MAPDGLIIHMSEAFVGRRNDQRMLTDSGLLDTMQKVLQDQPFVLYGDPAYVVHKFVHRPFRTYEKVGHPDRENFNICMSRGRVCVEWGFGNISQLWSFLDFKKHHKVMKQAVGRTYLVCTFLTNVHTCFNWSETSTHFGLAPPSPAEYVRRGELHPEQRRIENIVFLDEESDEQVPGGNEEGEEGEEVAAESGESSEEEAE
jgi:hypothetical protein